MKLSLIVAMAKDGLIGRGGEMPWHLPEDLKHFKQTTMGHPVLMGRKTFESIGKPLPGRQNIVITRNSTYRPAGVEVANDLDTALRLCHGDPFVIGGGEIYRLTYPQVQRIFVTEVEGAYSGDTYFPYPGWRDDFVVISERQGKGCLFLEGRRKHP